MTTTTAQVNNFQELMEARGMAGENPYSWARALYKYTDCGPWTTFLTLKEKAKTITLIACIFEKGQDVIIYPNPNPSKEFVDFMAFLGFNEDGTSIQKTSMDELRQLIRNYQNRESKATNKRNLVTFYSNGALVVRENIDLPVQYEEIYYESKEINDLNPDDIVGIKIGSIVEGSDVEIDPATLMFPFDPEEVSRVIEEINDEASFYWKRDNHRHYFVTSPKGKTYFVEGTWSGVEWAEKPRNKAVIKYVEAMIEQDRIQLYDDPRDIEGCKGWTVTHYLNDAIY